VSSSEGAEFVSRLGLARPSPRSELIQKFDGALFDESAPVLEGEAQS
jgi:hypothetical protein